MTKSDFRTGIGADISSPPGQQSKTTAEPFYQNTYMASAQGLSSFVPKQHLAERCILDSDAAGQLAGLPHACFRPDGLKRVRQEHLEARGVSFQRHSAPPASSTNADGVQEPDISLIEWLIISSREQHHASWSPPSSPCLVSPPSYEDSIDNIRYPSLNRSCLSSSDSLNLEALQIWASVDLLDLR